MTGCTKVSPGCDNCYAEAMAERLWGGRAFTDIRVHPERLDQVRKFKPIEDADGSLRPRLVFVNSMSDIFHEEVPDAFRDQVFDAIEDNPLTVFQCLTKRAHTMRAYIGARFKGRSVPDNIWLGPSVEDNRVKGRLRITRALKDEVGDFTAFASVEPIIGPCDALDFTRIDWVLTGGESGWRARPMQLEWLRQAHHGARAARATIHFKQFGHARNNPLVTALKRDHGYSLQRAFAEACSSGLEKEPGEKGGATLDGEVLHEKPPAYYRIKDRLNQQPIGSLV
jgi:protein gp37